MNFEVVDGFVHVASFTHNKEDCADSKLLKGLSSPPHPTVYRASVLILAKWLQLHPSAKVVASFERRYGLVEILIKSQLVVSKSPPTNCYVHLAVLKRDLLR